MRRLRGPGRSDCSLEISAGSGFDIHAGMAAPAPSHCFIRAARVPSAESAACALPIALSSAAFPLRVQMPRRSTEMPVSTTLSFTHEPRRNRREFHESVAAAVHQVVECLLYSS
jgi:hypothetical protein